MLLGANKLRLPAPHEALPGRDEPLPIPETHFVSGANMRGPYPGMQRALFGLGCFWGAQKRFWERPGVHCTHVGYAGGFTPNPHYQEVCSGLTGHNEVVRVVFDEARISYQDLLAVFWQAHDPTQGMRQGNDLGTQYRSLIMTADDDQRAAAEASRHAFQANLTKAGYGAVTTEIAPAGQFYYAEDYHQQYLDKNPRGYCPANGTGVSCPIGVGVSAGGVSEAPINFA